MTRAEAKREACFRAGLVIESSMGQGWPGNDADRWPPEDLERIERGLLELVEELLRRGAHTRGLPS